MQKKKWSLLLGIILGMMMLTIPARAATNSATFIFMIEPAVSVTRRH